MAVVQLRKTMHGMWAAPSKCVEQNKLGGAQTPQFFGTLVGKPRILGGPVEPWLRSSVLSVCSDLRLGYCSFELTQQIPRFRLEFACLRVLAGI